MNQKSCSTDWLIDWFFFPLGFLKLVKISFIFLFTFFSPKHNLCFNHLKLYKFFRHALESWVRCNPVSWIDSFVNVCNNPVSLGCCENSMRWHVQIPRHWAHQLRGAGWHWSPHCSADPFSCSRLLSGQPRWAPASHHPVAGSGDHSRRLVLQRQQLQWNPRQVL